MKENYTYPVIVKNSDSKTIEATLIDFKGITTCLEKDSDIVKGIQDFLAITIQDYEDEEKYLPVPSEIDSINVEAEEKIVFVNVWMPYYRSKVKEVYVKKTVTLPAWIDELGKRNNINFSATLVEALKEEFNLK